MVLLYSNIVLTLRPFLILIARKVRIVPIYSVYLYVFFSSMYLNNTHRPTPRGVCVNKTAMTPAYYINTSSMQFGSPTKRVDEHIYNVTAISTV